MSISFFRVAPTELDFVDNSDGGGSTAEGAFGAEFRKKHSYSILTALPVEQVESVTATMRSEQHKAGEVIFREGAPADKFMVIVEGEAEVLRGDSQEPTGLMGPGHFFGETSALRDTPRLATVRAKTDVTLLALDGDAFRGIVAQALGTTADFNEIIAKRLQASGA
jgi:CRP-like cAMP-binding protein